MSADSLSIIIPCRHDAAALAETLPGIVSGLLPGDEIIIALADEDETAAAVAVEHGARVVISEKPGRGPQMNAGARAAHRGVLVFNHADTALTAAHLAAIRAHFTAHPAAEAGAFFKDTRANYPAWAWADPLIRWWMGNHGLVYGDQSVFLRRVCFDGIGGFRDLPLMEDIAMSPRLRRAPGFRLLDPPLRSSLRRFAKCGRLWTRLQNIFYILCFRCGVSAERIYRWYYGKPVAAPAPSSGPRRSG